MIVGQATEAQLETAAASVRAAVDALNVAIRAATEIRVHVEVRTADVQRMQDE